MTTEGDLRAFVRSFPGTDRLAARLRPRPLPAHPGVRLAELISQQSHGAAGGLRLRPIVFGRPGSTGGDWWGAVRYATADGTRYGTRAVGGYAATWDEAAAAAIAECRRMVRHGW